MTNAEKIRQMDDDELAGLLVWGRVGLLKSVPSCDSGCDNEELGCAIHCPHEQRECAVRRWLQEEY